MPYKIIFNWTNGEVSELKPIAPDSMNNPYGYEDRRIKNKANNIVKWINRISTDVQCKVEHYE